VEKLRQSEAKLESISASPQQRMSSCWSFGVGWMKLSLKLRISLRQAQIRRAPRLKVGANLEAAENNRLAERAKAQRELEAEMAKDKNRAAPVAAAAAAAAFVVKSFDLLDDIRHCESGVLNGSGL
uniref:4F5 domain-containing protein n=1 Tax=Macrostomum lignano TaxID=282301 RepID=A0A1I8FG90_9PLAT